jgi:hypothetical protein
MPRTGKPIGRPAKKCNLSPEQLAEESLKAGSRVKLMARTGIGEESARLLRKAAGASMEEFRELQRVQLQGMLDKLGNKLEQEIDDLSSYQKVIAYGILTDKLHNQPQSINNSLHIHLKGGDSASALRSILGPAADKLLTPVKPEAPPVDI